MSTETINAQTELNNDELCDESTHRPWNNIIRGRSTYTANIFDIQHDLKTDNEDPIHREDIAQVLHNRSLPWQTKVIQTSSNLKYISIQFNTSMIMETFCTNSLNVKNYTITFKPDFNKRQKRYYETEIISFLNVPSEAEEEAMTQFAQQCAVVLPRPRYPTENINDIDYLIGTRIYKVHSSKEHIPRQIKLFGRQIQCIYANQPKQQAWIEK